MGCHLEKFEMQLLTVDVERELALRLRGAFVEKFWNHAFSVFTLTLSFRTRGSDHRMCDGGMKHG